MSLFMASRRESCSRAEGGRSEDGCEKESASGGQSLTDGGKDDPVSLQFWGIPRQSFDIARTPRVKAVLLPDALCGRRFAGPFLWISCLAFFALRRSSFHASLVVLEHNAVLPRRAVLLHHELERYRGDEFSLHGYASPHLGVIASHGAENSRGDGLPRRGCCVCKTLLSHSFGNDDDEQSGASGSQQTNAVCVHRRGTAKGRRRSWGTWRTFFSDQTKPLLRRDRAFPPKSVRDGCLW
mmetsp:Transcript_42358/g.57830  ORF Transcript_42358/g.57830 Transcript_42358/m.57830 type:complete len:239 (-) Transcript_42358:71-787(-)